jgi:protein tyrosine phosphatase (PTP) superfamily phosphohydrolase (DUF442 family)/cytochrome c556
VRNLANQLACVVTIACLLALSAIAADDSTSLSPFKSVATEHLPNAHRVTDKLISGAQPEGDQGFKELRDMGVKTIVSVDGAAPDVETAKKYGLRYVHLPITYSGVTADEGKRIAKALNELDGPIYLHCHHGQHRSAAAVAVACVLNGSLNPEQAESVLKTFGTGKNYLGLWKAAREARPLDKQSLDAVQVKYVETAKIPELAERMVKMDETWDSVKLIQKNAWMTPKQHPDLDPAHEALLLQEHLKEAARADGVDARPEVFRTKLSDAERAADDLRAALEAKPAPDCAKAETAFKAVSNACLACHKAYRD